MALVVSEPDWHETLERVSASYYKLILIVGPVGSGKTSLLKQVASYNFHYLNFGEAFSRSLLPKPMHLRAAEAEEVAVDLVKAQNSRRLALDNTEVLFEAPILLNPLTLLKNLSIEHLIVATWTGSFDQSRITYGIPGHPSYQEHRYTEQDTFIIVPTEHTS